MFAERAFLSRSLRKDTGGGSFCNNFGRRLPLCLQQSCCGPDLILISILEEKGVLSESMIRNTTRNQKLGWVLFIAYLTLLVYFMFFAESFGRNPDLREYSYNLELFKEIRRFYKYRKQLGMEAFLLNIVGNVVGFMPCGFFLPIISRRSKKFYNTFLFSFCLSLCIETTQLVFRVGSFDVDDLFLNTLGGVLGFCTHRMVQKVRIRRRKRK